MAINFPYARSGRPKHTRGGQIAFYQPFFDRFLLVVPQETTNVAVITMLANSRYPVFALDISNSPGYRPDLLDNHSCDQWTSSLGPLGSRGLYRFDRCVQASNHTQPLTPSTPLHNDWIDFSIEEEKQWMQALWFWTDFLEFIDRDANPLKPVFDFSYQNLLPKDTIPPSRQQIESFHVCANRILSIEIDLATADKKLQTYLNDRCPDLINAFDQFCQEIKQVQ